MKIDETEWNREREKNDRVITVRISSPAESKPQTSEREPKKNWQKLLRENFLFEIIAVFSLNYFIKIFLAHNGQSHQIQFDTDNGLDIVFSEAMTATHTPST